MNKSNMLMKIANYTLLLALLPFLLSGQVRPKWEWGLFAGGANYLGDLVETEYPVPGETNRRWERLSALTLVTNGRCG
jgi:hypothetical protein